MSSFIWNRNIFFNILHRLFKLMKLIWRQDHCFGRISGEILPNFEHTKSFFWQFFLSLFLHIHKKCFFNHFFIILKTKHPCCQQNFFLFVKYSKIKLIKTFFSDVSPKIVFWNRIWSKNLQKQKKLFKKSVEWFFSYTNLSYWFLRAYCEISAHTDVANIFSILNFYLP